MALSVRGKPGTSSQWDRSAPSRRKTTPTERAFSCSQVGTRPAGERAGRAASRASTSWRTVAPSRRSGARVASGSRQRARSTRQA